MSRGVKRFNNNVDGNLKRVRKFQGEWRDATQPLRGLGRTALVAGAAVGAGTAAVAERVLDKGAAFEKTMKTAATKFGDVAKEGTSVFADLEQAALNVGENTELSATQAAGALKFMAMAGEDPRVAMKTLSSMANLASASGIDLARSTDIVSDALGPMMGKIEGTRNRIAAYNETADLMNMITTRGNTTIELLGETVTAGASTFRGANQDIRQFAAAVDIVAAAGIKGGKAGKDLKRLLSNIVAPTKKVKGLFKELKFDPIDADGNIRQFDDLMTDLKSRLDKLDPGERFAALTEIAGANSKAAADAIFDNLDGMKGLIGEMGNAAGITEKQALDMRDSVQGARDGFKSAIEAVELEIFQVIKEDSKETFETWTEFAKLHKTDIAEGVRDSIQWLRDNLPDILKWGKRIGAAFATFWLADKAIKAVEVSLQAAKLAQMGFGAAVKIATPLMRGAAKVASKMAVEYAATGGSADELGKILNGFQGTLGKVAGGAVLVGTAVAAWSFGRAISHVFDLDNKLGSLLGKITAAEGMLARAEAANERQAVKSRDEEIERVRSDLAESKAALKEAGGLDNLLGNTREMAAEVARGESQLARLQRNKAFDAAGVDRGDTAAGEAFQEQQKALRDLNEAKARVLLNVGSQDQVAAAEQRVQDTRRAFGETVERRGVEAGVERKVAAVAAVARSTSPEDVQALGSAILEQLRKAADKKQDINVNVGPGAQPKVEADATNSGRVNVKRTGTL